MAIVGAWNGRRTGYNDDVYLKFMCDPERIPHWWYIALLVVCLYISLACFYGAGLGLPAALVSFPLHLCYYDLFHLPKRPPLRTRQYAGKYEISVRATSQRPVSL